MPYGDIKLRQLESTDARLARLNGELREASAQTILRVAMVREWPEQLTYVSSFGAESVAMLSLIGVRSIPPNETERKVLDPDNKLWQSEPDACCALRKVRPLEPALEGFDAWITGRKRFHGGERMKLPVFEFANGRYKVNPMAGWTADDVDLFMKQRNLPRHPLVDQGYPSIGCWPCTRPASDPLDPRSGRWAGQDKTECGLHLDKTERPRVF